MLLPDEPPQAQAAVVRRRQVHPGSAPRSTRRKSPCNGLSGRPPELPAAPERKAPHMAGESPCPEPFPAPRTGQRGLAAAGMGCVRRMPAVPTWQS